MYFYAGFRHTYCTPFNFPSFQEPLVTGLLAGVVDFEGDPVISIQDLRALSGEALNSEGKWLPNFVVDGYLKLITTCCNSTVTALSWESFEKWSEKKLANDLLSSRGNAFEEDLILAPCNQVRSHHWFLLCVLLKEQQIIILDSATGRYIRPTHQQSVSKMWGVLLQLADGKLSLDDWSFYVNGTGDIQQQDTSYNCDVCMRELLLFAPLLSSTRTLWIPGNPSSMTST